MAWPFSAIGIQSEALHNVGSFHSSRGIYENLNCVQEAKKAIECIAEKFQLIAIHLKSDPYVTAV